MKKILVFILCILMAATSAYAAKFRPFTSLTGGGNALDGLAGTSISAGDGAFVITSDGTLYIYVCKDVAATESSPYIIAPDTADGNKRWYLVGTFGGKAMIISDADGRSITAEEAYGAMHVATGTGTWTLPPAVAGMNICLYSTTAANVVLDCDSGDHFVLDGVAESNGEALDSNDTVGEYICVVATDADTWLVIGTTGDWTGS